MAAAPRRTAAEFLTQYLDMSGFNGENGPFMVCKELLDNAVDACAKNRKPGFPLVPSGSVQLELQLNETALLVSCRDTGAGINADSVSALGDVFCSSKSKDSQTGGEFGIGLKAIMLYSQRDLKEPINVVLRLNENEVWSFSLSLNESSVTPAIENFKVESIPSSLWPWMTEFSIKLSPLWDSRQEAQVESYAAAHAVWSESVKINTLLAFHPQRSHQSPKGTKGIFLPFSPPLETHATATASALCDEIKINLTAAVVSTDSSESNADIFLLRSFNGMPLVSGDASACVITKSLRLFLAQSGQYFGLEPLASDAPKIEPLDCNRSVWNCLTHASHCMRVRNAEASPWNALLLAVNVTSEKALFGTLSKSFLTGSNELTSTLTSAFHRLFNHLKKALPSGFQSAEDTTRNKATNVFAPNMAASVAGIICASSNPKFQAAALELLGLKNLKLQPDSLSQNMPESLSLSACQPSKRARTRAINEIIQDSVLERILQKLNAAESVLSSNAKKGKAKARASRCSPTPSPLTPGSSPTSE